MGSSARISSSDSSESSSAIPPRREKSGKGGEGMRVMNVVEGPGGSDGMSSCGWRVGPSDVCGSG